MMREGSRILRLESERSRYGDSPVHCGSNQDDKGFAMVRTFDRTDMCVRGSMSCVPP